MRKVILGVAVTLDGLIEGPSGEYDWCFTDQDYGMTEFMKRIDAIFFGRKSYEMMSRTVPAADNPWKHIRSYVFSNTLTQADGDYELVGGNVVDRVNNIKQMKGKDIWLFGGASLTTSLLQNGLVDEIGMAVHPILLGAGKPLFSHIDRRIKLQLVESKSYDSGLVYLTYRVNQ